MEPGRPCGHGSFGQGRDNRLYGPGNVGRSFNHRLHGWVMFLFISFLTLDIPPAFPQTFPSLFRDGNGGYSKKLPPEPGNATFRRGQHLSKSLLSGRCPFGTFRLACARGEVEDTVQTTIMPLGSNAQLFGEVGIFPNQHCRR